MIGATSCFFAVKLESPPPSSLRRRLILWTGSFLLPFILAAIACLFPQTQRFCANLVLRTFYPGGTIHDVSLGFHQADLAGVRLPMSGGILEIQRVLINGKWWQFLRNEPIDQQHLLFDRIQYQPANSAPPFGASRPFSLSLVGGIQDVPSDPRRYVGTWHIQSLDAAPPPASGAPSAPASMPANPPQLNFDLEFHTRDLTVPGVQPFALAYATGTFDMGFLWNYSADLIAQHDQLAVQLATQFSLLRSSAAKQAAALRLLDSPNQHWKIFATFTNVPSGGFSWEIHATLWGDPDLASDLNLLNLLERTRSGQPVTDNAGLQQGPTIVLTGLNNQLTSSNIANLLLQTMQ